MKRVAIFAKEKPLCQDTKKVVLNLLKENDFPIDENNPEVVIVIGGDGTFLRAVHRYLNNDVMFVGLNAGHLGFFSEFELEEINLLPQVLKEEKYDMKSYRLLNAVISSINESKEIYAVNEVRIENPFSSLTADVSIDGKHLEKFRGNGLVVCSAIGSSAYNKSLGGAIVDTSMETLELTEIAAIQNNVYRTISSSYVVNGESTITFEGRLNEVVVGFDSETIHLDQASKVTISLSKKIIKLIDYKHISHVKKLKDSFIE
ncbi:MAG: NAD kinase [Bacilli bacterium]|nr:NAD kinase [Bacilli bacterium]